MAKNGRSRIGQSIVDADPMTNEELNLWFDDISCRLMSLRRISGFSFQFREAIIDALERFGFTWSHAVLAERWLELGKWHEYRRGGEVMITDFLPGAAELQSIGELDEQINVAIRRCAAAFARANYVHTTRVSEMLSEVRIDARTRVLRESKTNTGNLMQLLYSQNEEIKRLKYHQKGGCSWRFHPRFNQRPLPRSRKF